MMKTTIMNGRHGKFIGHGGEIFKFRGDFAWEKINVLLTYRYWDFTHLIRSYHILTTGIIPTQNFTCNLVQGQPGPYPTFQCIATSPKIVQDIILESQSLP